MTKDEIKNRISMALKSPVLQQGFEIICKQNIELGKHNEELIALINAERGGQDIMKKFIKNVYIIIRYFGFDYLRALYENYKTDKDNYENFAECVQDELYALADSM